jgi:hypothetical protein
MSMAVSIRRILRSLHNNVGRFLRLGEFGFFVERLEQTAADNFRSRSRRRFGVMSRLGLSRRLFGLMFVGVLLRFSPEKRRRD